MPGSWVRVPPLLFTTSSDSESGRRKFPSPALVSRTVTLGVECRAERDHGRVGDDMRDPSRREISGGPRSYRPAGLSRYSCRDVAAIETIWRPGAAHQSR